MGNRYVGGEAGHTLLLPGYLADENLCVLGIPAIATPCLHLMIAGDLKRYCRSDGYGETEASSGRGGPSAMN